MDWICGELALTINLYLFDNDNVYQRSYIPNFIEHETQFEKRLVEQKQLTAVTSLQIKLHRKSHMVKSHLITNTFKMLDDIPNYGKALYMTYREFCNFSTIPDKPSQNIESIEEYDLFSQHLFFDIMETKTKTMKRPELRLAN